MAAGTQLIEWNRCEPRRGTDFACVMTWTVRQRRKLAGSGIAGWERVTHFFLKKRHFGGSRDSHMMYRLLFRAMRILGHFMIYQKD